MHRVGDVVAEHARCAHCFAPLSGFQSRNRAVEPFARELWRASPVAVARMQNVIFEVLELVVRSFRACHVGFGMQQEQAPPALGVRAGELLERVERELVVRAVGMGGGEHTKEKAHEGSCIQHRKD